MIDLATSYAAETLWWLIVKHPHVFEEILDDVGESCYRDIYLFIEKVYEKDDPALKRVRRQLTMLQDNENAEMDVVEYGNTGTTAYFDGEKYYNHSGQILRPPSEYNQSEGYTPFGDE